MQPGDTGIEVVLFDVGGVIVPPADAGLMGRVVDGLGLSSAALGALFYEWEPWYALSTGRIDANAYWAALGERAGREPGALRRLVAPVWEPSGVDAGVMDLAVALSGRVRLAILSNATVDLEGTLRRFGVARLFDPIINSARIGLRKPDPAAFARALDMLGVAPGAVLLVDDKRRNTSVAEELGIPCVLFDGAPALAAALVARGLLPSAGAQAAGTPIKS